MKLQETPKGIPTVFALLTAAMVMNCLAEEALRVVAVQSTQNAAATLRWASTSNAIYRIDYTTNLNESTEWLPLYDDFPSHGTNTFWTDVGDEFADPGVVHPNQASKRFYRVVQTGTNSEATPLVTILTPATNAVIAGYTNILLSVSTSEPVDEVRLYVDGQEVWRRSGDTTNFTLNSCQWANGEHVIFAVAANSVGGETTTEYGDEQTDYQANFGVSDYLTVSFNNLISKFSATSRYFEPTNSQAMRFSADFSELCDWTLNIRDSSSNTVRSTNGTGTAMVFDWDGRDSSSQIVPAGFFSPELTATISNQGQSSFTGNSQTNQLIPPRIVGQLGSFGIAYQGHHPAGALGPRPNNGLFGFVSINALPGYGPLRSASRIASGFNAQMIDAGYIQKFRKADDRLLASQLRKPSKGGTSEFNKANIGLLIGHQVFGSTSDFTISGSGPLQSYFPIYQTGASEYDWVRISEFDFGSSDLRWMCILSCNNLKDSVYDDMYEKVVLPINDDLHLLCGASTSVFLVSRFGDDFGTALTGSSTSVPRMGIRDAWFFAAERTQRYTGSSLEIVFRVAGWANCFNDDLISYESPNSGNPADIETEDFIVP
jgi:hypothetical protein